MPSKTLTAFPSLALLLLVLLSPSNGRAAKFDIGSSLDACNVTWTEPGPTSAQSMPIGNGDIALNVWGETNGDVVFYIGKTDSWNEDVRGDQGLMKVGKVRISVKPNTWTSGAPFTQTLKLHDGEIEVQEGSGRSAVVLRIWVDANHPVIRIEAACRDHPITMQATMESWRLEGNNPDVIPDGQTNRVVWYHRNRATADAHVANLTFGAMIKGAGFSNDGSMSLKAPASKTQVVSIYPLTATTATREEWLALLDKQVAEIEPIKLETARKAHQAWWDQFWNRSWVYVTGDKDAAAVTRGYVLQRFVTACAGRGAYPIKFNGSLFVVDVPAQAQGNGNNPNNRAQRAMSADFRTWGGQYWFQNTRAMYWPRLEAGDFDMMLPLFKMYSSQIAPDAAQINGYYHHDGAYFAETAPFWGSVRFMGPEVKEDWTGHYFTPILELSMMMFDYYEFTGDKKFAKETLLPMATAGLTFYNQHFKRDDQGKLLLDPDNSIEQFWKVHDPAPDIAALHAILQRMLALPDDMLGAPKRPVWQKFLAELPELPTGTYREKKVLLPYTGEQTARPRNSENPELYAIYPFRLYGLGKPDLQLAVDTFELRKQKGKGCWVQDPIQAAMLGLPDVARTYITYNFTNKEPRLKFPAFWAKRNDYAPDEDNGGNGENGLQQMLLQADGRKIMVLPAWPKGWNAEFKLNAPFKTTVQGSVQNGVLKNLVVTPSDRKADVIVMAQPTKN